MACSVCHVRGHNKRGCPQSAPSAESNTPLVTTPTDSYRRKGRSKKTPPEAPNAPPQEKSTGSSREIGRPKKSLENLLKIKEKRETKKATSVAPSAPLLLTTPSAPTVFPASSSEPPDYCASSLIAGTIKKGMGSGRKNKTPFKRLRIMGMSVFQAKNDFKVLNPGMTNSKIYSTNQANATRSADVLVTLVIHQVLPVS